MTSDPTQPGPSPSDPYRPYGSGSADTPSEQSSDQDRPDPTQPYTSQPYGGPSSHPYGVSSYGPGGAQPGGAPGQQPYPPYQAAPYGSPYGYAPNPPSDGMAIGAMVTGIVAIVGMCFYGFSLLASPVALILGRISMKRIDASQGRVGGRGFALTGFILGIVGTVLLVLLIAAVVAFVIAGLNGAFDSDPYDPYDEVSTALALTASSRA